MKNKTGVSTPKAVQKVLAALRVHKDPKMREVAARAEKIPGVNAVDLQNIVFQMISK